ncbi:DUF302 domain-containing protein [Hydrogenovibrio sp. 3SP14C1]|uniref:DUF302 domain-containing protein n=1 Tax=Hydrogenovibrio sp. 3SP14C1 TaxID=3038774 RepID=UPI00241760B4|nr:DUF302 domain-containing protein [Hydrogenovibrio sp. 3SP14C1]MDG4812405.1 DUF302 domain-containing protein [Hydrogenovibrio sp. 3SP14C1]
MMRLRLILLPMLLTLSSSALAADGLISIKSPYSAGQTMQKLEEAVQAKGLKIFVKVNHTAGAKSVGQTLRPTSVLIFGNPKGGTPFMRCSQTIGIDTPLKALVWKDKNSQVWLSYNAPDYISKRHQAENCPAIAKISNVLDQISHTVTSRTP